eukprot:TRINITY_DN3571_c0_g1_i12.p2 TRINITY_DN3571_c0_g1~~TRINITY_DN3571_c0_g1_i12.p2  ORF type:complete len:135 (+),score=23.68 TRINITY_DN3571_c0_g1_i12:885-1289(+)
MFGVSQLNGEGDSQFFCRTNHFLAKELQPLSGKLIPSISSAARFSAVMRRSVEFSAEIPGTDSTHPKLDDPIRMAKEILQDKGIIKPWARDSQHDGLVCGTVCVVVLDLVSGVLNITTEEDALVSKWKSVALFG